ncbi:MAG: YqgE/AlgH family protein [Lentimicrobiaceae bacterium]|nr:YqgE/AlgH family protein [Lentimicrobiaceae bacterium]
MQDNPFLNFSLTQTPLQSGKLLVAVPLKGDFFFDRSVILLVEHNEKGSFGITLNKDLPLTLKNIFPDTQNEHIPVWWGGPVDVNMLFFLHSYGDLLKGSIPVTDTIHYGASAADLLHSIKKEILDENLIRFYLGYAGWTDGQLEEEINQKLWVVADWDEKKFFDPNNKLCWNSVVESLGSDFSSWLDTPEEPYLN